MKLAVDKLQKLQLLSMQELATIVSLSLTADFPPALTEQDIVGLNNALSACSQLKKIVLVFNGEFEAYRDKLLDLARILQNHKTLRDVTLSLELAKLSSLDDLHQFFSIIGINSNINTIHACDLSGCSEAYLIFLKDIFPHLTAGSAQARLEHLKGTLPHVTTVRATATSILAMTPPEREAFVAITPNATEFVLIPEGLENEESIRNAVDNLKEIMNDARFSYSFNSVHDPFLETTAYTHVDTLIGNSSIPAGLFVYNLSSTNTDHRKDSPLSINCKIN